MTVDTKTQVERGKGIENHLTENWKPSSLRSQKKNNKSEFLKGVR